MARRERKLVWWGYLIAGVVLIAMGLYILQVAPDSSSDVWRRRGLVVGWMTLVLSPLFFVYGISLKVRGRSHG
ncbi:hypothetical protein V2J56_00385 [Georgenia sp. MJ206]|uniref:hypothetical protein n=1 Tax=Georgenia wangjunii TaxID=3117730 RepID=UPI002F26DA7B